MNSDELKRNIHKIFPKLKDIWIFDRDFIVPTLIDLDKYLQITRTEQEDFIDGKQECDDFALFLHADMKRALRKDNIFNWPFGQVFGTRFNGVDRKHNANICYTQSGLYLIEPQTDERWLASKNDNILFMVIL